MIENGSLESEYLNLCFFLPSISDRSEEVNQYLNNINITPIYIIQGNFQRWLGQGEQFEPQFLELHEEKN